MKKFISILLMILFVGTILFSGCTSNTIEENDVLIKDSQHEVGAEVNSENNDAEVETKLTPPALPED
jgi:hypothetical protein